MLPSLHVFPNDARLESSLCRRPAPGDPPTATNIACHSIAELPLYRAQQHVQIARPSCGPVPAPSQRRSVRRIYDQQLLDRALHSFAARIDYMDMEKRNKRHWLVREAGSSRKWSTFAVKIFHDGRLADVRQPQWASSPQSKGQSRPG